MTEVNPAETYEQFMVPTLFEPWAVRLVELAAPADGERVLDVGCGTGIVARTVARRLGRGANVAGIDPNPLMLDVARAAAERDGQSIAWHDGRAEELPFASARFDLVACQFALMFFADRAAALSEMRRVLVGGGRLALSVFQSIDRHPFYGVLDGAIEQRLGSSGVRDIFALGDPGALREAIAAAGFSDVEIVPLSMTACFPNPDGFLAGEIDVDTAAIPAMQRLDTAARENLTGALAEEMRGPLREVTNDGRVEMPFHVLVALATR